MVEFSMVGDSMVVLAMLGLGAWDANPKLESKVPRFAIVGLALVRLAVVVGANDVRVAVLGDGGGGLSMLGLLIKLLDRQLRLHVLSGCIADPIQQWGQCNTAGHCFIQRWAHYRLVEATK